MKLRICNSPSNSTPMLLRPSVVALTFAASLAATGDALAQAAAPPTTSALERGPQQLSREAIQTAIDSLGNLDFPVRMNASRALRRAPAAAVVPALIQAVEGHKDQFVRFRALVLLTAFNDGRTAEVVRDVVTNPNDRLRTVAYMYYERHPAAAMLPTLLKALEREESEFVRPALVRALAAQANDPRVRETMLVEVGRGQDFFRSAVIEALGDYRATYALAPLMTVARLVGPLQADAVIALGKLKDERAMETLASLQRSAPRDTQPTIAAAICLLGTNCDAHVSYLIETLRFAEKSPGFQELLRNTVAGLVALANSGNIQALTVLFEVGVAAVDPPRAPMALGIGTVAIRNTPLMLSFLETYKDADAAISLIAEGFDMLEEDYAEESFFAAVRRGYWQAAESSATRRVGQALIDKLEF
jgi:HEAT repeat protein